MKNLTKIRDVLALKRSQAEREIAELNMRLQALDSQLGIMETQIGDISATVFSGEISDDPIGDAVMLEKWRDVVSQNMRVLQTQKEDVSLHLSTEKQLLKEILVKEDIINIRLKSERHTHDQNRLESESSARLENWIVLQSRF